MLLDAHKNDVISFHTQDLHAMPNPLSASSVHVLQKHHVRQVLFRILPLLWASTVGRLPDSSSIPTHIQKDFQRLLQNLKDNFSGLEIDCRLRPEGKSSRLVWDLEQYKKYFSNRARI
jgi:hypothetical protein